MRVAFVWCIAYLYGIMPSTHEEAIWGKTQTLKNFPPLEGLNQGFQNHRLMPCCQPILDMPRPCLEWLSVILEHDNIKTSSITTVQQHCDLQTCVPSSQRVFSPWVMTAPPRRSSEGGAPCRWPAGCTSALSVGRGRGEWVKTDVQ